MQPSSIASDALAFIVQQPSGMVRFVALAVVLQALAACATEVPRYREPPVGVEQALRDQFNAEVRPLLSTLCASCHDNGGIGPQFMATDTQHPTMYDQVTEWQTNAGQKLVDLDNIAASYLLGKGAHNGAREFNTDEIIVIRGWIQAEVDARATRDFVRTDELDLAFYGNDIDLGDAGLPQLAGTRLTFSYTTSNTLLYFEDLTLVAGPSDLRVEEPLVVPVLNGVPVLEVINRFEGLEADVAAGTSIVLDTGLEPYVQLADVYTPSKTLRVAFYFRVLETR